jgi:S1-C subfamily serine protease
MVGLILLTGVCGSAVAAPVVAPVPDRSWLGLGLTYNKTPKASAWLQVEGLVPNGPAQRSGIELQDIITAIDGRPVPFRSFEDMLGFFLALPPGRTLRFSIVRNGKQVTVAVRSAPLPEQYYGVWERQKKMLDRGRPR